MKSRGLLNPPFLFMYCLKKLNKYIRKHCITVTLATLADYIIEHQWESWDVCIETPAEVIGYNNSGWCSECSLWGDWKVDTLIQKREQQLGVRQKSTQINKTGTLKIYISEAVCSTVETLHNPLMAVYFLDTDFLLLLTYLYFLFMVTLTAYAFTDPSVFLPCLKTMLPCLKHQVIQWYSFRNAYAYFTVLFIIPLNPSVCSCFTVTTLQLLSIFS